MGNLKSLLTSQRFLRQKVSGKSQKGENSGKQFQKIVYELLLVVSCVCLNLDLISIPKALEFNCGVDRFPVPTLPHKRQVQLALQSL